MKHNSNIIQNVNLTTSFLSNFAILFILPNCRRLLLFFLSFLAFWFATSNVSAENVETDTTYYYTSSQTTIPNENINISKGVTATFYVSTSSSDPCTYINVIEGEGNFKFIGDSDDTSTLKLPNAHTYSGTTTISSENNGIAELCLIGRGTLSNTSHVTLNGKSYLTFEASTIFDVNNPFTAPITMSDDSCIQIYLSLVVFSNVINGGAVNVKSGSHIKLTQENVLGRIENGTYSGVNYVIDSELAPVTITATASQYFQKLYIAGTIYNENTEGNITFKFYNDNELKGTIKDNDGTDDNTATVNITKEGSGTTNFYNQNTYSGTTTIYGGTLKLSDNFDKEGNLITSGTLGTGAISTGDTTNHGTLEFTGTGYENTALSTTISGSGTVLVSDGKTILSGTNSNFSGQTNVYGGTLFTDNASALGTSSLTVDGGTLEIGSSSTTASSLSGISNLTMTSGKINFDFNSSAYDTITVTNGPALISGGVINLSFNDESVWKSSATETGYKLISYTNQASTTTNLSKYLDTHSKFNWDITSKSDGTYITACTDNYWNAGSEIDLQAEKWTINENKGEGKRFGVALESNQVKTYDKSVTFETNGHLDVDTDSTLRLTSSNITLPKDDTLEKIGAGTLELTSATASSDYLGTTKVSEGTLLTTSKDAIAYSSSVIVAKDAVLTAVADQTLNKLTGDTQTQGGTLQATNNSEVTFKLNNNEGDDTIFGGAIIDGEGTVNIVKTGTGTLSLRGVDSKGYTLNTYTGTTMVSEGTLNLASPDAIWDSSSVTIAKDAFLTSSADSQWIESLSGSGTLKASDGCNVMFLTSNYYSDTTFEGTIIDGDGTVNIIKEEGTLTLTGNNTYTGTTTINDGGTLKLSEKGTLGTGAITMYTYDYGNYGTLEFAGTGYASTALSTVITGIGNVVVSDGTTILAGENTYKGTTTVSGGTLKLTENGTLGTGTISTGDTDNHGTLEFAHGGEKSFDYEIEGSGNVTVSGNTVLTLTNKQRYTGETNITSGSSMTLETVDAIGSSTTVTNNGTINLATGENTLNNLNGTTAGASITTGDDLNSQLILTADTDTSNSYAGKITGNAAVTKSGVGTLVLSGANDYSGTTTVSAGTLKVSGSGVLGGSGDITNTGTLEFSTTGTTTLNRKITGEGGNLTVSGGTLELTNSENNYSGKTTVSAGTLKVSGSGTLGGEGDITNTGTLEFSTTGTTILDRKITGEGGNLTVSSGTLQLTAQSNYTGETKVSAGTLKLSAKNAIASSSDVVVQSGAKVAMTANQTLKNLSSTADEISAGTSTTAEIQTGGRQVTVNTDDGTDTEKTYSYYGSITGNGSLKKTGKDVAVMYQIPGYTGRTTLEDGTLKLASTDATTSTPNILYGLYSGDYDASTDNPTLESTGALEIKGTSHYVGIIKAANTVDSTTTLQTVTIATTAAEAMVKLWSPSTDTNNHSQGNFVLSSGNLNMKGYYEGKLDVKGGSFSAGNSIGTVQYTDSVHIYNGATWTIEVDGDYPAEQQSDLIYANCFTFDDGGKVHVSASPTVLQGEEFLVLRTEELLGTQDAIAAMQTRLTNALDDSSKEMWTFLVKTIAVEGKNYQGYYLLAQKNLVPEPSTWALLILGCAGLLWLKKSKKREKESRKPL